MTDPLAEVVTLLQPNPGVSKTVGGAGRWRLERADGGRPFYCVVLGGGCRLSAEGEAPIVLEAGDFVLIPAARDFTVSSLQPPAPGDNGGAPVQLADGEVRVGARDGLADVRMLVGHCVFGSPDAGLLVSLLPRLVHVCGDPRLTALVRLVREESQACRPAREVVLARLLEVLLIEALRSEAGPGASPGLLRALADPRLAAAIRRMHERPEHGWTIAELAGAAAMSRSTFFARFERMVGTSAMAYLLAWRMAHGAGAGPAAPGRGRRSGGRTRRLRLGQHVQHRLHPSGRLAAERARAGAALMTSPRAMSAAARSNLSSLVTLNGQGQAARRRWWPHRGRRRPGTGQGGRRRRP